MKKIVKIFIFTTTFMTSLLGHGQPDNIFGMTTLLSMMPTVYVSNISSQSKTAKEKKEIMAQKFIEENRESLEVEVAQGEGEKLDTLATLYGVEEKNKWKSELQDNYETIFYNQGEKKKTTIEITGELNLFFQRGFK